MSGAPRLGEQGQGVEQAPASRPFTETEGAIVEALTAGGADLLSIISDCVARLPHGPGTPGPGLELGESAEAYALLDEQTKRPEVPHLKRGEYVSVCINGLWIGASRPKTEGK